MKRGCGRSLAALTQRSPVAPHPPTPKVGRSGASAATRPQTFVLARGDCAAIPWAVRTLEEDPDSPAPAGFSSSKTYHHAAWMPGAERSTERVRDGLHQLDRQSRGERERAWPSSANQCAFPSFVPEVSSDGPTGTCHPHRDYAGAGFSIRCRTPRRHVVTRIDRPDVTLHDAVAGSRAGTIAEPVRVRRID